VARAQGSAPVLPCRPGDLLIRSSLYSYPDRFRTVRDLGCGPVACTGTSGESGSRSLRWLPAWLPAAWRASDGFCQVWPQAIPEGREALLTGSGRHPSLTGG
jgi:hypothetical protein